MPGTKFLDNFLSRKTVPGTIHSGVREYIASAWECIAGRREYIAKVREYITSVREYIADGRE